MKFTDPQGSEGVCAGSEEEADQPPHDALDLSVNGRDQLDALPRGSRGSDLDEGGAEEDHRLLHPGGEGDLLRSMTRFFKKIHRLLKIDYVFNKNC